MRQMWELKQTLYFTFYQVVLYVEIPRRKNKINQFINEQRNAKALTETGEKEI